MSVTALISTVVYERNRIALMTSSVFRSLRSGFVSITLMTAIIPALAQQHGSTNKTHGFTPTDGFVPDSQTAVKVAEAVLIPVYGEKQICSEEPFTAELKGAVWTVGGTLRCPDGKGGFTTDCDGGVAVVKLSKTDGRVLFMLHYK
jgi:hypothetical protein